MAPLDVAAFVLEFFVSVLALMLARKRPNHRPVAALFVILSVLDLCRWFLHVGPLSRPGPYTGAVRLLFHADQLAFLAWPLGSAALAWVVFLRRPPVPPLFASAAVVAVMIAGYPTLRQRPLAHFYTGIQIASIVTMLACVAVWHRKRLAPGSDHAAVLMIPLLNLILLFGPYTPLAPDPFERWTYAQMLNAISWLGLGALHISCLSSGFLQTPPSRHH